MDHPRRITGISSARVVSACILYFLIAWVSLAIGCSLLITRLPHKTLSVMNDPGTTGVSPTIIPAGTIFRDDFNGPLSPAWEWENEEAPNYQINENGWLEITAGDESLLTGGKQTNLLWITLPQGNFEISIHLRSQPLFDFQRAGLLLYRDPDHYILLSHGYCMQCVLGGSGIFLEFSLNGHRGRYTTTFSASDLYLMLIIEQGAVSAFYAIEAGQWQHIASLKSDIHFERAALSVTNDNTWDTGYDLIGIFDYFVIRRPTQIAPTPTPSSFQQAREQN